MIKKTLSSPLVEQITYSIQSFLSLLLISRFFDASDFGLYNLIVLSSLLFSNVLISATFLPMVPLRSKIEQDEVALYDKMVAIFVVFLSSISIVISFSVLIYQGISISIAFLLSLLLSLRASFEYIRRRNIIIDNCKQSTLISIFILLVLFFLLVYSHIVGKEINISLYLYLVLPVYLIPQIGFMKNLIKKSHHVIDDRVIKLIKLHFHECKWIVLTSFTQIFSSNYFLIALASQLGGGQLGVFRAIQNITNFFNPFIAFCDNNVFVKAGLIKKENGNYKRYIFLSYVKVICLVFIPIILMIYFKHNIVNVLYSSDISEFSYLLPVFLMSILVVITSTFFRLYLRIKSINQSSFWFNLIIAVFAFFFAPTIITEFGIIGAAYGVLVTQILFFIGIFIHYLTISRVSDVK